MRTTVGAAVIVATSAIITPVPISIGISASGISNDPGGGDTRGCGSRIDRLHWSSVSIIRGHAAHTCSSEHNDDGKRDKLQGDYLSFHNANDVQDKLKRKRVFPDEDLPY